MLNEKQLEVVNCIEGPVVVLAGPGTGKTKTLIERVINLLVNKKVAPDKIMLTTFTNKATKELEIRINERLKELNEDIDISGMYLGTMHSIWIRLIRENIFYSNFFDAFEVMSGDYEQHFFIYSRLKEYKKIENYKEFFSNVSKYKACNTNWEKSKFLKEKINAYNESAIDIKSIETTDKYIIFLKEAYKLYEKFLFENNIVDFAYLQIEFLNMISNSEEFFNIINNKFDYIMVDEYQDSNRVQEKILLAISKKKKNICVVGDEDQSIYRFRGASAKNIIDFRNKFSEDECKLIILNKNYRSVQSIVEFNNSWINSFGNWKGNRFEKNIISMKEELTNNVYSIFGKNISENVKNTVTFIKKIKDESIVTNYNQIAILFSDFRGTTPIKLKEALEKANIDVCFSRGKNFFENKEIKVTLGLILGIFKEYFYKSKNIEILKEERNTEKEDKIKKEVFKEYLFECLDLAKEEVKKDRELYDYIKKVIENMKDYSWDSLNELFYEFFKFSYYKEILKNENNLKEKANHNLSILSKLFKSFQKYIDYKKISFNKLDDSNNLEENFPFVRYFFDIYIDILKNSRVEEIENEEDIPSNCIPFLSIHQSKGLEFPVVIVFSLDKSPRILDYSSTENSIDRMLNSKEEVSEQEKEYHDFYRKYYVAFTRAQKLLVLSSYEKGVAEVFKNSFYSNPSVNSMKYDLKEIRVDNIIEKEDKRIFSYTTDISIYKNCPQRYYFIREKSYATYFKKEFNLGIIAHKVIEYINKLPLYEINKINEEFIEKIVKNVYKFQKEKVDENFKRIVELVKKYVENEKENFKYIKGSEVSEYSVENSYILYGELDLILEKDDYIEIIDFKTGKYRENNIYNENYKEQLSLYKYLLQKKYNKEIKTSLYYLEEDEPKKEILITNEDFEKNYQNVDEIAQNILAKKFDKIVYNENLCERCEFKNYCWGK